MSHRKKLRRLNEVIVSLTPALERYYRRFFAFAGLWNIVLTLGAMLLITIRPGSFSLIGMADPGSMLPYYALLPQVTLFGFGYYSLSQNLASNHYILKLGVLGKTAFFLAVIAYYWQGLIGLLPVLILTCDMIQVCMFIEFLHRLKRR